MQVDCLEGVRVPFLTILAFACPLRAGLSTLFTLPNLLDLDTSSCITTEIVRPAKYT